MERRTFLAALAALTSAGCKSKAQKQADVARTDLARVEKTIAERHVDAIARALPAAAAHLASKLEKDDLRAEAAAMGAAFTAHRDKTDDLRSCKRSYFALTDAAGEVVWVDDDGWNVVGRKMAIAFQPVKDVIEAGKKFATGPGRYGGAPEDALTLAEAAVLEKNGARVGLLVACWEAHDAAEDLRRQMLTELAMKTAQPKVRAKAKDKLALALDQPDLWIALFRADAIYLPENTPQPLEDGVKAIGLAAKTASGEWSGTFDVLNKGWGGAAKRLPSLGADVGVAVLRHDP